MATTIRPEVSTRNPFWINKHRYYELKHFCLQYPSLTGENKDNVKKLISNIAYKAEPELAEYIVDAVTKGHSFTYLKCVLEMPCEKDMYYNRYRKFFWLLDKEKK